MEKKPKNIVIAIALVIVLLIGLAMCRNSRSDDCEGMGRAAGDTLVSVAMAKTPRPAQPAAPRKGSPVRRTPAAKPTKKPSGKIVVGVLPGQYDDDDDCDDH